MKKSICELIGNTPTVRLSAIERYARHSGKIFAKAEHLNPAGSIKDRVASAIINNMIENGALARGGVVAEVTSGNTGIALAMLGAIHGFGVRIVMPSSASSERSAIIKAYGGEVILTDADEGMNGAIRRADALVRDGDVMLGQFTNPIAVKCHYENTATELWREACGEIDTFVCGVGTGATLTGVGRFLKEKRRDIRVIAVEPRESPVLSGGKAGKHGIEGIGAGFVPPLFDYSVVDKIVSVSSEEAFWGTRILARECGIFAGYSTGAVLSAVLRLLKGESVGKNIAMIITDGGERYLSRS